MRFKPRSIYDVLALVSFFLVVGGGTALASYVISSNSQVGPGTISGHTPPTGKHANLIAGSINGHDLSGGIKSSLRLHCPSDLQPVPDQAPILCAETSTRDPAPYATALQRCAAVNLRLPSDAELALVYAHIGAPQTPEWTSSHYRDSTDSRYHAAALAMDDRRDLYLSVGLADVPPSFPPYRCVTSPRN
jgi:hypothetical protein